MTYIIAEIGINHDGQYGKAYKLIQEAARAGADAVKFQKREPKLAVPKDQWTKPKETPWGETMAYIDYKERMELGLGDYRRLKKVAKGYNVDFSASVWDIPSAEAIMALEPPWIKVPSAKITDFDLLKYLSQCWEKEIMISTGMSTEREIRDAIQILRGNDLTVMHCNSQYPSPVEDLNLYKIDTLRVLLQEYDYPEVMRRVGYSGHETGLATTVAAVALGAEVIERHITLDRSDVGTDHASSVEPRGFARLVKDIHNVERALGHGALRPTAGESAIREKLRG